MKAVNFVTSYAIDVVLALAVAYFFSEKENEVAVFFGTLAILWIVPLGFSLWNLIRFWVNYHLQMKRRLVRYILAEFHRTKFPDPSSYFDWDVFASHVMEDPESNNLARLKAAFFLGEQASFRATAPMTMGIAMGFALLEAMDQYRPSPSNYSPQSKNL